MFWWDPKPSLLPAAQFLLQVFSGDAGGVGGNGFGRAAHHDLSPGVTAFGSHVDDPVGTFDHIEIVFDDNEGVAGVAQSVEDAHEGFDVGEVETGGGFVEQVEGASGAAFG